MEIEALERCLTKKFYYIKLVTNNVYICAAIIDDINL